MTVLAFITSLVKLGKTWLDGRGALLLAMYDTAVAAEQNKARLIADADSHNSAWEMAALQDSDKSLRRICFVIFSFPFVYAVFDPVSVQHYFAVALNSMPAWYTQTYMSIVGAVWGMSSLKNILPSVVSVLKK